jgi:hypothetical protein
VVQPVVNEQNVITAEAYILFYSKMSVDEFCRQTLSEPSMWPHILRNGDEMKSLTINQGSVEIHKRLPASLSTSDLFGKKSSLGLLLPKLNRDDRSKMKLITSEILLKECKEELHEETLHKNSENTSMVR